MRDRFLNFGYWMLAGLVLTILVISIGCSSPLRDASFKVTHEFHGAVTSFGAVAQSFAASASVMADKKHETQQALQAQELAAMYADNADSDGNLVLTPEDFAALTTSMIEAQTAIATSRTRWATIHEKFQESLGLLDSINVSTMDTAELIRDTEKSVQAFARQVTQTLGAIAAAAGFAL